MKRQHQQKLTLAEKRNMELRLAAQRDIELWKESLAEKKIAYANRKKGRLNSIKQAGYVFCPSDITLIGYYLCGDGMGDPMCPIEEEANVFNKHPRDLLAGKSEACYFFTSSEPNEDGNRAWIGGEKTDVFNEDQKKVGVKQVFEYCERGRKSKYKIIKYHLDPPSREMNFHRSVCKVYKET